MASDESASDDMAVHYRAGWSRVVLGGMGLLLGPLIAPELARQSAVLGAYTAIALLLQLLIKKRIGGSLRAFGGGLIDIAILTYLVQRLGSATSLLVSLYVFLGMVMALIDLRRVAYALSAIAVLAYAAVLAAEQLGWLPYAPDGPNWATHTLPSRQGAVLSGLLVGLLVPAATYVVDRLVRTVRSREAELLRLNAALEVLSQRDALTQLYNRRYLLDRIDLELARVRRGHAAALLMMDLDRFKRVNDEHGHLRGDDLLRQIAEAIAATTRQTDVPARYGGDEFAVLLADTDEEQARVAAERMVRAVRDAGAGFDAEQPVTASVGVAVAGTDDDARSLLRRADAQAYRAKERGGNRVEV